MFGFSVQMSNEIDELGTVKADGLKKGEHVHGIPPDGRVHIANASLLKILKEPMGKGMTNPDTHLARVNFNHLDPTALLQTKPFALDLADDESNDFVVTGRNKSHGVLFAEVVFHHLDPAAGDLFFNDRLLDRDDLGNVFSLDLSRFNSSHNRCLTQCE